MIMLSEKREAIEHFMQGPIELSRCFNRAAGIVKHGPVSAGLLALALIESNAKLVEQLAPLMPQIRAACTTTE